MIRLAFIGQQRSGKDTAGKIFKNWVGDTPFSPTRLMSEHLKWCERQQVASYSFAQPIKDLCEAAYGMHRREDLQGVGAYLRQYDAAFWVRIVERQIIEDNPQFAVIADVRYDNEVKMLSERGFTLVGIDAPDEERFLRSGEAPENWTEFESHDSEKHARATLLNAPHIIKNHGTKEDFKELLEAYFEEIK